MDALTRRKFLLASGVVGGGALAAGLGGLNMYLLLRTAFGASEPADERVRTLVIVTLYGGNDGLNTVVPYADPAYHTARRELAYAPAQVLRLDDQLGLNPTMTGLKRWWDSGHMAIVRGVGYPKPDRSHFRSMDIWQTASPRPISSGWVGRWLDGTKAAPETAVSFEPVLPPLLAGETRAGACIGLNRLRLPTGITPEMLDALGRGAPGESRLQARAASAYQDLLRAEHLVRQADHVVRPSDGAARPGIPATDTGGETALATQLALVARCVEAGVPTRVYSVSLGGFDTHAEERAGHERLLRELDQGLTGFVDRMAKTKAGRQVAVVVYSEFGRRVRGNASHGTDHGTAGPVFLLGARVAGGWYGEQPSLADLDDGDLKATMDFRDVVGTVLSTVLDAEPERYLPDYRPKALPLFVTG